MRPSGPCVWPLGSLVQIRGCEGAANSSQNWECEDCAELKCKSAGNTTPRQEWFEPRVLNVCHSFGSSFSVILLAFSHRHSR